MQQDEEPQGEEAPQLDTVSGVITDASTGNPILGATVRLLDQMVETGIDGAYAFRQVDYADALNLLKSDGFMFGSIVNEGIFGCNE